MSPFVDVHSHVTPTGFPAAPNEAAKARWPCMHCHSSTEATVMIGETPFRKLDARSWDVATRIEDMDRDDVAMQVLSPMPELLSYWLEPHDARLVCDATNHLIASMVDAAPKRFRGLGAVPLQDPTAAARDLSRLKTEFGLTGVEIGSNINGKMLGSAEFEPFWAAAEAESMAVFVHALHPLAAKALPKPDLANGAKPSLALAAYAGKYMDPWYGSMTIRDLGQGKLSIRFDRTPGMEGALEPVAGDKFRTHWTQKSIENAYVNFTVKDGSITGVTMAAISPLADFSSDYQDLHFTRAGVN